MQKDIQGQKQHEAVLVKEVLDGLHIKKLVQKTTEGRTKFIDATVGAGGHSWWIAKMGGEVLGMDADGEMLKLAREKLAGLRVRLVKGNFREIGEIARREGFGEVEGILFDLGVSMVHLRDEERGFSFQKGKARLDMRLDSESQGVTAADLLNSLREGQLEEMFGQVMGVKEAKRYAKRVIGRRQRTSFRVVDDLLEIAGERRGKRSHPATGLFLALRVAVNSELENLQMGMEAALGLLNRGGRMAVISFHSAEDRIVKRIFAKWEEGELGRRVTRKAICPNETEIKKNVSARSARLRIFEKQ